MPSTWSMMSEADREACSDAGRGPSMSYADRADELKKEQRENPRTISDDDHEDADDRTVPLNSDEFHNSEFAKRNADSWTKANKEDEDEPVEDNTGDDDKDSDEDDLDEYLDEDEDDESEDD